MSNVFIAFQHNEESRPVIDAIVADNPGAVVVHSPGIVKKLSAALDQCRNFFRKHRQISPVAFYDTAGSVKHVISNRLQDAGAIASHQAAAEYKGEILLEGLEDEKENFTRFFLVHKKKKVMVGADKTSLVFSLKSMAGSLFKALSVFALRDLDLCKIESRPVHRKPWEYVFFVDILRGQDEAMRKALQHLAEIAGFVKVLGVYPRAR